MSYRRRETARVSSADNLTKTEKLAAASSIRLVRPARIYGIDCHDAQ
jgi:hypothetical protein